MPRLDVSTYLSGHLNHTLPPRSVGFTGRLRHIGSSRPDVRLNIIIYGLFIVEFKAGQNRRCFLIALISRSLKWIRPVQQRLQYRAPVHRPC